MERISGVAGESITAYDLCYLKAADGKYWKAKADAVATMPGVVIATSALATDAVGVFIASGLITNSGWSWATIGGFVYASAATAGLTTQTIPATSGNQVQIVGTAKSATSMDFKPQLILIEVA